MRTPALALVTIAVLGASLINASPLPEAGSYNSHVYAVPSPDSAPSSASPPRLHPVIGTKVARDPDHSPSLFTVSKLGPRELLRKAIDAFTADGNVYSPRGEFVANNGGFAKRTDDDGTLGGNAHSGNSGDVNGGNVVNQGNNFGMPTITNVNSNNGGAGGGSTSGCANGGNGNGRGAGGNGYSGNSGNAEGGSVENAGGMMNFDSNNAGKAGTSTSGCANGGDVSDNPATA